MSKLIKTDSETLNLFLKSIYLNAVQEEMGIFEKEYLSRMELRKLK